MIACSRLSDSGEYAKEKGTRIPPVLFSCLRFLNSADPTISEPGTGCYFDHYFEYLGFTLEQFSYVLEIKTRERNRNKKRTEIERFDWFIERIRAWLLVG